MTDWVWIRPDWLWALLPWLAWMIGLAFYRPKQTKWHRLISPHLQSRMVQHGEQRKGPVPLILLCTLLAIVALAGPSIRTQESPLYSTEQARALILDMSLSMWATDVKPNRLSRLRYKAMDFIKASKGGEMGLLAYAGDAFVVSPLTSDGKTLTNLISALGPDVMPAFGSRPDLAVEKAIELLTQAGHQQGSLILMTDGISEERAEQIQALLKPTRFQLNIYQVGTEVGAPIQLPSGELLKSKGQIVSPKADHSISRRLSRQQGGQLITMSHSNRDIEQLAQASASAAHSDAERQQQQAQIREDAGPYLLLVLIPLLTLLFRKGAIVAVATLLLWQPQPAYAISWQDLWQTQEQQAQRAFEQGDFETAADLSQDPLRKGNALFRQGDFSSAQKEYEKLDTASGHYNRGNALAQQQQIDKAIQAYEQALALDPNLQDAKHNKEQLEKLKQQQQDQQNQDGQQQQNQDQNQEQEQEQDQSQQSSPDQSGSEQNSSGEQQQSKPDQEQQSADDSKNQESQQQDQGQQQGDKQESQPQDAQSENAQQQQNQQGQDPKTSDEQQSQLQQELAEHSEQQQAQAKQAQSVNHQEQEAEPEAEQGPVVSSQQAEQGKGQEAPPITDARLEALPDDPAVLLRNKMQLEYQKRRAEGTQLPENEVW